jgi:anti-sigma factor RsiW
MNTTTVTCELVDEADLDTRYLAGRLTPDEAEAFEAHFFGCERCWGLVQGGLEVQSAFGSQAATPASASVAAASPTMPRRWWGLAAAAGIVLAALGVWRLGSFSQAPMPEDVFRGGESPFVVTPGVTAKVLTAVWPSLPEADLYQVRLYAADGLVAAERQTTDTTLSLLVDSLGAIRPGTEVFWQVQAFDRLRKPVARSELTRTVLPSPAP